MYYFGVHSQRVEHTYEQHFDWFKDFPKEQTFNMRRLEYRLKVYALYSKRR